MMKLNLQKEFLIMNKKITARPCKEHPNTWEIEDQYGCVRPHHYSTKEECVQKARNLCAECGCELVIQNEPNQQ